MFRSKRRGSLACVRKNVDDRCQMTCDKVTEDLSSAKSGELQDACRSLCGIWGAPMWCVERRWVRAKRSSAVPAASYAWAESHCGFQCGAGLGERLAPALTPVRGLCRCAVGRFPGQRHHPPGCRRRLSPPDHPRTGAGRPRSQQLARLPAPTTREPLARQWTARGVLLGLELSTILCAPPLGSGRFCVA